MDVHNRLQTHVNLVREAFGLSIMLTILLRHKLLIQSERQCRALIKLFCVRMCSVPDVDAACQRFEKLGGAWSPALLLLSWRRSSSAQSPV